MLTREENIELTRVGAGTPCGELMRRYWHPVYPEALLLENPVAKVRILGEDLVLYRDRGGRLGLIGQSLSAPRDQPRARHPGSRRPALLLSRLALQRRGPLHRTAAGAARGHVQRQAPHQSVPGRGDGRPDLGVSRSAPRAAAPALGPVRQARADSVRSSRTVCPATGSRRWRTAATSDTPSICTAGSSNTSWNATGR